MFKPPSFLEGLSSRVYPFKEIIGWILWLNIHFPHNPRSRTLLNPISCGAPTHISTSINGFPGVLLTAFDCQT